MGVKGIVEKIREKIREHRIRRELEEIERIYFKDLPVEDKHAKKSSTSSGTKRAKKRTEKRKQGRGWDQLDEYFG